MTMGNYCKACFTSHSPQTWRTLGMVCGRCRGHTGNHNQGHILSHCRHQTSRTEERHFCCPENCEVEERLNTDRSLARAGQGA